MTTTGMSEMSSGKPPTSDSAAERAAALFADARALHDAALARLDAGDIREAAEKAWRATKRASDGLIVARTGSQPAKSPITTQELRRLARIDADVGRLTDHYHAARDVLHGDCFYLGLCEPADIGQLINETDGYIADAETLANPERQRPSADRPLGGATR